LEDRKDIFAIGTVLWSLLSLQELFPKMPMSQLSSFILRKNRLAIPEIVPKAL